jgi:hypothetical protein
MKHEHGSPVDITLATIGLIQGVVRHRDGILPFIQEKLASKRKIRAASALGAVIGNLLHPEAEAGVAEHVGAATLHFVDAPAMSNELPHHTPDRTEEIFQKVAA